MTNDRELMLLRATVLEIADIIRTAANVTERIVGRSDAETMRGVAASLVKRTDDIAKNVLEKFA